MNPVPSKFLGSFTSFWSKSLRNISKTIFYSFSVKTASSSYPMHIGLLIKGQIVVYDQIHSYNIDSSSE